MSANELPPIDPSAQPDVPTAPPPAQPAPPPPAAGGDGAPPVAAGQGEPGSFNGPDLTPEQIMETYGDAIKQASKDTGIPENVLAGMIWQESKGKADTPGGGLMQVGPNEMAANGGGDPMDPTANINAGAKYMQELVAKFGDIPTALRAYNSGPNGVDPNNLNATPAGTGDPTYVDKVMEASKKAGGGQGAAA